MKYFLFFNLFQCLTVFFKKSNMNRHWVKELQTTTQQKKTVVQFFWVFPARDTPHVHVVNKMIIFLIVPAHDDKLTVMIN